MRNRELFPLPPPFLSELATGAPSRGRCCRSVVRRLQRRLHWQQWCREGVQTLNELSGFPFDNPPDLPSNAGQEKALCHLSDLYKNVPPPPIELTPAGAFQELCKAPSRYQPDEASSGTVPYTK